MLYIRNAIYTKQVAHHFDAVWNRSVSYLQGSKRKKRTSSAIDEKNDGDDHRRLKVASVRVWDIDRSHLLFITVIHATVISPLRGRRRPRRYDYDAYVRSAACSHTHTHAGPRAPSLFRRSPSRTFREWAPLPPR